MAETFDVFIDLNDPGFLTKDEETGFKNCENAITTKLLAIP